MPLAQSERQQGLCPVPMSGWPRLSAHYQHQARDEKELNAQPALQEKRIHPQFDTVVGDPF